MYRIAVNVCKNKMASRSWREARLGIDLDTADATQASSPSPSQLLDAKTRQARIESAIARLPDEQRELVVLRDVEGRSYEEIAAATGLNPGTVKSRLNRGRAQLREWLRDIFLVLLLMALAGTLGKHG